MSEQHDVERAVDAVCAALCVHAEILGSPGANPSDIVLAAVAVSDAVLEHEAVLRTVTGWSSPMRHLGPTAAFTRPGVPRTPDECAAATVRVVVSFDLAIGDAAEIWDFLGAT